MRIFLDANILVSVLNKEYPLFTITSRILSLANHPRYDVYTSPLCLAIAFYFAEKKHKTSSAKEKIRLLCEHIKITDLTKTAVQRTLTNNAINDFEDGLEYYSAIDTKCDCIITEDAKDFYFSDIEIISSENFFAKYLKK
ncbi:PIN domain nuclease [soil metagenome]